MDSKRNEIQSALEWELSRARSEGRAPTVMSVANRAGVDRSTLYRYYPDIVARLRPNREKKTAREIDQLRIKCRLLSDRLKKEKQINSALAQACTELGVELLELRNSMQDERLAMRTRIEHLEGKLTGMEKVTLIRK